MNTGHEGSMTTLHANSPRDALSRLETMVLMAGLELPLVAVREQIASAVSLIIHTSRLSDGTRRITQITDVDGMEGETIQLNDLFTFDYDAGMDPSGRFVGGLEPTGLRPSFERRLHNLGFELSHELFGTFDD
jgi:pilus assembly protein CpaF